jgi:hypothetical protein
MEIEAVYSSHKRVDIKPIVAMDEQTLIHGIRGVNGKLTLFDYNNMVKFIEKYSFDSFKCLEQLLSQE